MVIINKQIDLILIKFPILFPIIYFLALHFFPNYEDIIILTTIFLLAEPHFGATWPFFFNKSNKDYIKDQRVKLLYFPVLIVVFCLLGYFYFKATFLLIFFAANIFHVTRQSYGVLKLYIENKSASDVYEIVMYSFNALFFLVGFLRFYIPLIDNDIVILLTILTALTMFLTFAIILYLFKSISDIMILFTGCIIFFPICFVDRPIHAILMGVTMHYTQYIALTFKVTKFRDLELDKLKKISFAKKINLKFLFFILLYSVILTAISFSGKSSDIIIKNIIIIGITLQMLHFYIDSQLWKFSNHHNRKNVLNYLVQKII